MASVVFASQPLIALMKHRPQFSNRQSHDHHYVSLVGNCGCCDINKKEKQNHFEIYFVTLFRYELALSVGSEFFVSDDNHQHWKYSKEASDDQQNWKWVRLKWEKGINWLSMVWVVSIMDNPWYHFWNIGHFATYANYFNSDMGSGSVFKKYESWAGKCEHWTVWTAS